MLETLKKKWWLVAIVVVIGGVLLNNAGIINKSAEKTLKSQNVWEVNIKNFQTGEMDDDEKLFWKFDKTDVFQGTKLEDVQDMTDSVVDNKASVKYVDKNTVEITSEQMKDVTMRLKLDDLNNDKMNGKITVEQNGAEVSTDIKFNAAK